MIVFFPEYLVELLWILMQKNKTVMVATHVPVYLAAYNATLSEADRYILLVRGLLIIIILSFKEVTTKVLVSDFAVLRE